jgi:hypothetical protein
MGIIVGTRGIITCAHVINTALGADWWSSQSSSQVRVSFPFADGLCRDGLVSRDLWFPPGRENTPGLHDLAVIRLLQDIPAGAGIARLKQSVAGSEVKCYGFRGETYQGEWVSHPDGQWMVGTVIGPQPGGRSQLDGLRTTGARVERGFSGAGIYSPADDAIIGMVVESDRDAATRVAQFIDAAEIMAVIESGADLNPFASRRAPAVVTPQASPRRPSSTVDDELVAFVGRTRERNQFVAKLASSKGHIHFVGHGGIGKSALLKKLGSLARARGLPAAYVDLDFVQSPLDLVRKLVVALLSSGDCEFSAYTEVVGRYADIESRLLGQPGLKRGVIYYLSKLREMLPKNEVDVWDSPSVDSTGFSSNDSFALYEAMGSDEREFFMNPLPAVVSAFVDDIGSRSVVFEFDRTERVVGRMGEWLIQKFLPRFTSVVTLSAGRDDVASAWNASPGSIQVCELGPLSEEESEALLENMGVPESDTRSRVASTSRGVPLALVLGAEVAHTIDYEALQSNVDSYVVDRMIHVFLDGIPDARRQALQRLSIFRRFNRETALELSICDASTIDEMLKVRFVKHVPQGYAIHDRVRDFMLRDLRRHQPKAYQLLHEEAISYYEARMGAYTEGSPDFIEWLYHELSAHPDSGFERLRKEFTNAALAIKPDYCEALIHIAEESNVENSLPRLWLQYFHGSIRRQRFDFRGAWEIYEEMLRDSNIERLDDLRAELAYQHSLTLWYLCRFIDAKSAAEASVALSHSLGKSFLENRSLGILGLSYDRLGRFHEGIRTEEKMVRQAAACDDHVSKGYALNGLGYFSWHAGEWRRTERALLESLETWRAIKNPVGECYPLGHLGLLYCATGRLPMALDVLTRGESISRMAGNLEMVAKILQNLSHYNRRIHQLDVSVRLGLESLQVCVDTEHPYFAADSCRLLSETYLEMKNFDAAKDSALDGLRRLPGEVAAYLHFRLTVASTVVDAERLISTGDGDADNVMQELVALINSDRGARYKNTNAEAQLGRLKLALAYDPSHVAEYFKSGAEIAFSYNWYTGMSYLERSQVILHDSADERGLAQSLYDKPKLEQLHRAPGSQTLKGTAEVDNRRIALFASGN